MKKLTFTMTIALLLFLNIQIVSAAISYPYSPTEVLQLFEESYKPQYDQINKDLHEALKKAKKWASLAALYSFDVNWADGTESTYTFTFISPDKDTEAYFVIKGLDNSLEGSIIKRLPEMKYGTYRVPMRLRDLIPAIKADTKLLPLLESIIDDDRDVAIHFTLEKNDSNELMWYIKFLSSIDPKKSQKAEDYIVKVSAEKKEDPLFSVQALQ